MRFPMKAPVSIFIGFATMALTFIGCVPRNPHDTAGSFRILVTQKACIAGKVTDSITGRVIPGAMLEVVPAIAGARVSTDQGGFYYAEFPGGNYNLRFTKPGYRPAEKAFLLKSGDSAGWDVSIEPTAPVIVNAGNTLTGAAPGSTVALKAEVITRDGSSLKGIRWEARQDERRVTAELSDAKEGEVKVTLPGINAYKASLLYHLEKDRGLLDRWVVVGLVPADLREAGRVTIIVTATTSSGTYTDSVDIIAELKSFADVNPGLQNIVIGNALFLQGKSQHDYAWTLVGPTGSSAVLKDATTRNPYFIPDIPGTYSISERNVVRLTIYAGLWNGAVVAKESGQRERWVGLKGCYCHASGEISKKFDAWSDSGHAEIFTKCVNTVFRYDDQCTRCHSVGFAGKIDDGGITSTPDYLAFRRDAAIWDLSMPLPLVIPKPTNFNYIFDKYPDVARLANVQCENCHGPNNSKAHKSLPKTGAPARISLNPEVCGTCHDRSRGDLSYGQWYKSKHSNFNLAIETGTIEKHGESAGDCGRCHTGQGFIAWLGQGKRSATLAGASKDNAVNNLAVLGLTEESALPITCAVCHDPHASGNSFRSDKEKVPVRGIDAARMLPVEFRSEQPGRGSLCIICHSTIVGSHNDSAMPRLSSAVTPHVTQADVLFGQNAFFIKPGVYKSHARIEDSCIWCHIKQVPKPSEIGYPRGGVNHSFRSGVGLCSECHKRDNGLMDATNDDLKILKKKLEKAIKMEMGVRGDIRLAWKSKNEADATLSVNSIQKVSLIELTNEMGVEITTTSSKSYKVSLADIKVGDTLMMETVSGQVILKAAWNYFLVKNDRSNGVHNPKYVSEVLAATIERLRRLTTRNPNDEGVHGFRNATLQYEGKI